MEDTAYTGYVDRNEWRWILLVSVTLLMINLIPYVVLALAATNNANWQFMGVLHDYVDGAASLARVSRGMHSELLVPFFHTPEENPPILLEPIYPLIGQFTALTFRSPVITFHLFRAGAALLMYLAIYQLGATIWLRERPRRIFFILATIGSGVGWLVSMVGILPAGLLPDLTVPLIYPFYSAAANVHYPLAMAFAALLAARVIPRFRPGAVHRERAVDLIVMALLVLGLSGTYVSALLPLMLATAFLFLATWIRNRRLSANIRLWMIVFVAAGAPMLTYASVLFLSNAHYRQWIIERAAGEVTPLTLLLGVLFPVLIAIPGLLRAIRRFEPDGDRFMICWVLTMVTVWALPIPGEAGYLFGLMIPIGYFATRACEDFWFNYIKRRHRGLLYVIVVTVLMLSHALWLLLPLVPIQRNWQSVNANVLDRSYTESFGWLSQSLDHDQVVLTAPQVGVWVPYWLGARVVYGHPAETLDANEKLGLVYEWYAIAHADDPRCEDLIDRYEVAVVVVGPYEERIGPVACATSLLPGATFGEVTIYITRYAGQ